MAQLLDSGLFSLIGTNSAIGVGWKLFFYAKGTTTPTATYPTEADANASTNANANPVVIGADGRIPPIWVTTQVKCVLKDALDITVVTKDPVNDGGNAAFGETTGATLVGYKASGAGTVPLTVAQKLLRTPEDHGVTYDGTGADTTRLANFFASARTEKFRNGGRAFLGEGASFNGAWGNYADYTGLSPLTRSLHNWGPRDAQVFSDSSWAGLCVVGSSQASKVINWPGYPAFIPSSIGVAGFGINDVANGQAWGGYFDVVRMAGVTDGFTVAMETALANFGSQSKMTPFNVIDGSARGGVGIWVQTGGGLDLVESDLAQAGLSSRGVNHASSHVAFLSSYQQLGVANWANSTTYAVGNKRRDPVTDIVWQCVTAHTSPGAGTMSADRVANPGRWKQIPAALAGITFDASALAETSLGADIYSGIEWPERTQLSWWRLNGSGVAEQSATIYTDRIADGTAVVPMVFRAGQIYTSAFWSGNADGSFGAKIQGRGSGGNQSFSFRWTGVNVEVYVDNILVKTI